MTITQKNFGVNQKKNVLSVMNVEEGTRIVIDVERTQFMLNVKKMKVGKLYRLALDTQFWSHKSQKAHWLKRHAVIMFLGYRERETTLNTITLEINLIMDDLADWVSIRVFDKRRDAELPADMLETRYQIPFLDEVKLDHR